MDTLTKVLDSLHFESSFYFSTHFAPPWSVEVPQYKNVARFHYVTQGRCWVRIPTLDQPLLLNDGDLIIIPHGSKHILSVEPDLAPLALDDALEAANYDGSGYLEIGDAHHALSTQLVCGHFEFSDEFTHPLVEYLPDTIVINENDGMEYTWLKDSLRFMAHIAKNKNLGNGAIIKRLSEIIFIQSIKHWNEREQIQGGFLVALNDPQLSKSLRAFHDNYSANWTVESLASRAGMSRSLFSGRFKEYLNLSPMQYVTYWRMQNAQRLLIETGTSIDLIASAIGYETLASFSKAFKRTVGISPGEYRKTKVEARQH
ncbi:RCS-specific HTH-type transcriptional activator RclR [BD1-7 clade bacterium]|nr:RCS-specific HTH-type transcriptional activator RclR [BD1-7 clade bacterium]